MNGPTMWVDGRRCAALSPLDRGLHYGEGVFETIACLNGRARFLTLHLERLALGCRRLGVPEPPGLRAHIERAAADPARSLVKVLLTRGPAAARGYRRGAEAVTCVIIRYLWSGAAHPSAGARVRIASVRLGENPALAGLKHCNRLEQILAVNEADGAEADEALMLSSAGQLIGGTMTNVFLIDRASGAIRVRTPEIRTCGVAGVMRAVLMREAARAGVRIEACALSGRELTPGPVTEQLHRLLQPLLEAPADG